MTRSVKKGPFCDPHVMEKAEKANSGARKGIIKIWSRRSMILPEFVGLTFGVHNGKSFSNVFVTENMVGHRFGEFAPTRAFRTHGSISGKR